MSTFSLAREKSKSDKAARGLKLRLIHFGDIGDHRYILVWCPKCAEMKAGRKLIVKSYNVLLPLLYVWIFHTITFEGLSQNISISIGPQYPVSVRL